MKAQSRMRTEPLAQRPRPLFHWQMVRSNPDAYLVWSNQQRADQRYWLGAIHRVRGGYRAYIRGKNEFHKNSLPGIYPTRERASGALVIHLNRHKYGRERLDAANIRHWRTPR